jgi:peptidoglycan/xylan/chitin deacetylase (PgdA/CDA1 family)
MQIANDIIAALKSAGAPAMGFINGVQTEREPASAPALDAWRAAGLELGNHGWSHANLDDLTDAQFAEELARNEPILKAQMGKARLALVPLTRSCPKPPRIPPSARASANCSPTRATRSPPSPMDFSDWAYNGTYVRCMAKGDQPRKSPRSRKRGSPMPPPIADRYRAMSRTLYGRDIPYVLLMHLGALDARLLPQLIKIYQRKGFRFVTVAEASRDPYYAGEVNPALAPPAAGSRRRARRQGPAGARRRRPGRRSTAMCN